MGAENNKNINNVIFENSDFNIIMIEGNLIGINKYKNYIEKNNDIKNKNIVINKKDKYSIDKNLLNKVFDFYILGEIKYQSIYSNLVNKNYKMDFLNFKKKYRKDYIDIYNKIN